MEIVIGAAKPRLSELVAAAQRRGRVVIAKHGEPAAELVACPQRKRLGSIDFERLEATCAQLGIEQDPPEVAERMIAAFQAPALSRKVLGLDDWTRRKLGSERR